MLKALNLIHNTTHKIVGVNRQISWSIFWVELHVYWKLCNEDWFLVIGKLLFILTTWKMDALFFLSVLHFIYHLSLFSFPPSPPSFLCMCVFACVHIKSQKFKWILIIFQEKFCIPLLLWVKGICLALNLNTIGECSHVSSQSRRIRSWTVGMKYSKNFSFYLGKILA